MRAVRILAIDNSSDTLSVALRDGGATRERSRATAGGGAKKPWASRVEGASVSARSRRA